MPSPFPGMDPYLEGSLWSGFHGDLATEVKRQLAGKLSPGYYPYSTRYIVYEWLDDLQIAQSAMIPDVGIAAADPTPVSGGLATLEAPARMRGRIPVPVPHYRIEIRDIKNRDLVTVIEFLSPTNKYGGGRRKYLRKRRRLLVSSVHLLEMDLLLQGERLPMNDPYPLGDYYLLLSRSERRPIFDVWPIQLNGPLPPIPIPLLEGDPDVSLDMQLVFNTIYDLGVYANAVNYRDPPEVTLSPAQAEMVDQILSAAGYRSQA